MSNWRHSPQRINHEKRQTAVMLYFPDGVKPEQARAFMEAVLRGVPAERKPEVVQAQEFCPDYGGVTIYQP
jgi:hypothetical protein